MLKHIAQAYCCLTVAAFAQSSNPLPVACATLGSKSVPIKVCTRPNAAEAGDPDTTVSVFGQNFVASSVVQWNGKPRQTTLATDPTTNQVVLKVILLADDLKDISTNTLTIFTPSRGASSPIQFIVWPQCGSQRGIFDGVPANSNGKNTTTPQGCHTRYEWECVDFIKRYYNDALGIARAQHWIGDAEYYYDSAQVDIFDTITHKLIASNKMLSAFPNAGATPPAPRDIVVFKKASNEGHVAVVYSISPGCTGTNATKTTCDLTVIEQNWSKDAVGNPPPLTLSRVQNGLAITYKLVRGSSAYKVVGWLRAPDADLKPIGSFDPIDLSKGKLFGWAQDLDSPDASVTVNIYVDKNAGTAGASPIAVSASDFRSDVGNHAFNYIIPPVYRDGHPHTVWVWAIDLPNGARNVQLPGSPQTFTLQPQNQLTTAGSTAIITGVVNGQTVDKAYVPIPTGSVAAINVDSTTSAGAVITSINMPSGFSPNATAADPATQTVVVVSYTSPDVQIIDASRDVLVASLTSSVTQFARFSGGSCMICGVLIDSTAGAAILDTAQGYILLNLATRQFTAPVPGTVAGENFGFNPNTRTVLNPTYGQGGPARLEALNLSGGPVFTYTTFIGDFPDAIAVDSSTNIGVVPDEFTGTQYLINLAAATFDASSSPPQFSAPSSSFPINFTDCGGEQNDWSLVSAEVSTHLLFLATEFADCAAVESLPTTVSSSGAPPLPLVFHWGHMPLSPDGQLWDSGGDPHGIAVFTSVINGQPYGFLIRSDKAWVARLDLMGIKTAALAVPLLNEIDLTPYVAFLKTQ